MATKTEQALIQSGIDHGATLLRFAESNARRLREKYPKDPDAIELEQNLIAFHDLANRGLARLKMQVKTAGGNPGTGGK